MYILILLFIAGLIAGSFLNSVIYRLPDLKSIISQKSHCPRCKKPLRWYDMIPLLSFVVLSACCRDCKGKISWQYPLVELATALLFVFLYLQFGLTLYTLFLILASCFLIVIFVYDFYHQLIPDETIWCLLGLWLIAYGLSFFYPVFSFQFSVFSSLYGILISAGVIGAIVLITRGKGMGIGDIKLAIPLGLLLGYPNVFVYIFFAFVIGAIVGIILVLAKNKKMKDSIAFGPFMIAGFYIALFFAPQMINWYLK